MAHSRKGSQVFAATRTGVPVYNDYEINEPAETRNGAWLVVIAVAIAFGLILQMEAESSKTESKRTASSRMATVIEPS
jgi:hypothetical protein